MAAEHPGVRPTQKRYGALAARQRTAGTPRSFQQFGGFTALLEEALADA